MELSGVAIMKVSKRRLKVGSVAVKLRFPVIII